MGVLDKLVLMPTAEQLPLLEPLILLMLMFLLPFVGLVLFSALLSLGVRWRSRAVARELIDLGLGHPAAWILFGILPLVMLAVLTRQYFHDATLQISSYFLRVTGLAGAGFIVLLVYRRTLQPAAAALGVLLVGGAAFHLSNTLTLAVYPQLWSFVRQPLPFFVNWEMLFHFLVYLAAALLVMGAAILGWRVHDDDPGGRPAAERSLLRGIGLGAVLAGVAALPPLLALDYMTAPVFTLVPSLFRPGLAMVGILLVIAMLVLAMIQHHHSRRGWLVFVLAIAVMSLFARKQEISAAMANREHELVLGRQAAAIRAEEIDAREALYASSATIDPALGEQIYKQRCSACHAFDERRVGPPYNDVLPKYRGDPEALASFVYKPVKVNPDYPNMPDQGLKKSEARSVAAYLLERFTGEPAYPDGGAGGTGDGAGAGAGAPAGAPAAAPHGGARAGGES